MKNKRIYQLVAIIVLSCFPFLFSLQGDFVFDDTEAIIKNKDIVSENWLEIFNNDFWGTNIKSNFSHKSYRPLTILTFKLNYILNNNKFSATQYKVTNLFCHMICCILVWNSFVGFVNENKIECREYKDLDIPFLAAVLFAVHPIHVEAICGIVGRADLLAGVTFFLGIILYQRARHSNHMYIFLILTIICGGLSLLFKENGITVLGFCIVYDLVCSIKIKNKKHIKDFGNKISIKLNQNVKKRLTILLIAIIVLLYGRWKIMGESKPEFKQTDNPAAFSDDYFIRVTTFNYIYFINLLLLFWPQWLCYDWSMGCIPLIKNVIDYRLLAITGMYIYGFLFLWALFKDTNLMYTKRMMSLAIALVVIPFIPASNIFYYVGFVIAERIMYISSAGYCLLITIGLNKISQKFQSINYKIFIVFFIILIVIYAKKSWNRSYDWQNEYQLYLSALPVCPFNAKVHYNVAKVADASQQTEFALLEYNKALRLYPEYYQAMNNLANMLRNEKKYNEAEKLLRSAIKHKPDFPAAWMNLGIVLASTKNYEEALFAYKTALHYRKKYPDCFYNLGNLYLEMSRSQDAIENWNQAIHFNSKHVLAWTNLLALLDNSEIIRTAFKDFLNRVLEPEIEPMKCGKNMLFLYFYATDRKGKLKEALELIPKVLNELPDSPSVLFSIANIYGKLDRFIEAEDYFIKAIKLFGPDVQAIHYSNLGVLYHRWKKYHQAKETYMKALKVDPLFKSATRNLKMLENI